jgi:hypothetical protein
MFKNHFTIAVQRICHNLAYTIINVFLAIKSLLYNRPFIQRQTVPVRRYSVPFHSKNNHHV